MTYFALFSIFPFVLLLIALLSFALDSKSAQERVISFLSEFFPQGATGVQSVIESVIAARGVAAGFGIVLLLWGALGWFENIDRAVNEMWGVERPRPFLKGKLFALAMILGIGLVMLLSWLMNISVGVVLGYAGALGLYQIPGSFALWDLVAGAITLALMFVVFLLLYRFSPMCSLTFGQVWRGALITAILWEVVRSGFAVYVSHFANFSSAYGPIAAVIAFLVWLYVAHMIILFGSALTYSMQLDARGIREPRAVPCAAAPQPDQRRAEDEQQEPAA